MMRLKKIRFNPIIGPVHVHMHHQWNGCNNQNIRYISGSNLVVKYANWNNLYRCIYTCITHV